MREKMTDSPINLRVLLVADRYLSSARILLEHENRQVLASFILAALAAEIYLKSFLLKMDKSLIEEIELPHDQGKIFSYEYVISNSIWEHKLTKLYACIKNIKMDKLLLDAIELEEDELIKMFTEFENYFTGLRYQYEDSAKFSANSGILELAQSLKAACYKILETNSK
ncbi:hypothetical protein M2404_003699 [Rheinheimera pacifica]|uniref:hypothetical protein n=1 Tax=Rheinheimera pacifica TaxID=173990 RepID=UPI002167CE26|nr:hypothetical protein [Rheinheimera pacifica]MCS4309328.1 hypothetical protein [Rheinheimera pacifica]